jgi:hypothetical protein
MTHTPGPVPEPRDEDRELVELIAASYRPAPMSPARQAAFRRSLEARLSRRVRLSGLPAFAVAASAALLAVLWIGAPRSGGPGGEPAARRIGRAPSLYAFVDGDSDEFLPDDYLVLASVFEVPVDDF